jgi:UDP-N-acetylglucosamine 2-epimerase (non-hydrolysing)
MTKLKVTTIVGTRPEIIRLSEIIKKFDVNFKHRLVHTGQNPDPNLKDVFFSDLNLRKPDVYFGRENLSLGGFLANLFIEIEKEFKENRPDAVVILGDTNSALSAIIAKRLAIPVYHLEAGNRSFDSNVPEEINRKLVDHVSDFNLAYTEQARENLLREGLHPRSIAVTGSPLLEVLTVHRDKIMNSKILDELDLEPNGYFLVSMHRQENIDFKERFAKLVHSLNQVAEKLGIPVLVSTHPRTMKIINESKIAIHKLVRFHEPFNFSDYNKLQIESKAVLSDSGTISEEAAMMGFPALTIRNSIERPEALEGGNIIIAGIESTQLMAAIYLLESNGLNPTPPLPYSIENCSQRVVNYIFSTVYQYEFWSGLYSND